MILLVHHADAVGAEVDPMRPLSDRGRTTALLLADEAGRRGVKPAAIWHSGKLRARQTAEPFLKTCNPFATFTAEHGLQPGDPPSWLRDRLAGETRDLLIAGHMPHLLRLLRLMTTGNEDAAAVEFPPHGMVALEAEGSGWREVWRYGGAITGTQRREDAES